MKRVITLLFLSLSISTVTSSALAQAGGEGGGADGAAGESSVGSDEGSPDAGAGDAGPQPKQYDLLENDGGRACSLGGPSGGHELLLAFTIAAIAIAARRRAPRR